MSERDARQSSVRARITEFELRGAGELENTADTDRAAGKRKYSHTKLVLVLNALCSILTYCLY